MRCIEGCKEASVSFVCIVFVMVTESFAGKLVN